MNDFIRPFTDEEFNKAFLEAGYPEIAWKYCYEKWREYFDDLIKEDLSEKDLPELREHDGWTSDCIRNQAWTYVNEYAHIDIYVQRRESGHGHEWAKLFCEELAYSGIDDAGTYWNTFGELRSSRFKSGEEIEVEHNWLDCSKSDFLSCKEYVLPVKKLARGEGDVVERYIDYRLGSMYEGKTDELLSDALNFRSLYESLISEGYEKEDAFCYALDLSDEHHPVFYEVYREAIRHGEKQYDAWSLADFCERAAVNGHLFPEINLFKNKFTEPWQREIYAGLLIKESIQDDGSVSTLHENDIRKLLDLNPIEKPLTWKDEEFLRLKKKYIESGHNEFVAEQRAYKEVYENDCDIATDSFNNNRAHDVKREMLEMMFPNDDIDSEDFEDGLDLEDMSD